MSLIINHNMMAANAARSLTTIYGRLSTSVQRLSSGLRVNSAADDAAGLAIRELMRADIAVINQGVRNASDAISMIQTAEGAMSVIDEKLIRMKELAEQAATGTYTTQQRIIINSEYQAMAAEIDRIANATDFNGVRVLDGSLSELHDGSGMKIHFGTGNDSAEDYYFVSIGDMRATSVTGLQVGGGSGPHVAQFRTTGLDMADTDTETMANFGTFGIQTSTDGTTWTTYGYLNIKTTDTLDDVVAKVGSSAGTNSIDMSAVNDIMNLNGETIVVNGHTFTFSTADPFSTANTIGVAGFLTPAQIAKNIQYSINMSYSSMGSSTDVFATIDPSDLTTVHLIDSNMGTSTGTLTSSYSSVVAASATFTNATDTVSVSASAVEDPDNEGEYELQLDASGGYVRLIQINGVAYSASTLADGGTPTAEAADPATILWMLNGSGWADGDEATEWYSAEISWDGSDILTQSAAQLALAQIDIAINEKDTARANLGAIQNRLENTITNLQIQAENLQSAESRISDVDVALEMTEFTRNNIMAQAAVAMLAQANSLPQLALQLLG